MFSDPMIQRVADAVEAIGLKVRPGEVPDGSVLLPGLRVEDGGILVDETKAPYPGDLLHEAGHLAVMPPEARTTLSGTLPTDGGLEMAALAWSYAMAVRFELPLDMVFHDAFKSGGPWLRELFGSGQSVGVPLLQLWDMCRAEGASDGFAHLPLFPNMAKWLRDR
jgi:hypothetical protein